MTTRAIVVGAGIGGLCAALALSARGMSVAVLERAERPGGKMRELDVAGRRIDSGPTVFTMPWVFKEVFEEGGSDLEDHVALQPLDLLARHGWSDGSRLDLFADPERSATAIEAFSGPGEAERYRAFCERARRTFETVHEPFIRSQRPSMPALVASAGLGGLLDLWRIRPFRSLWRELGTRFDDPRLRGLFARYATYCGGSPLRSPATLMLIAHVEQRGVWRIAGGMQRLADALRDELVRRGGEIEFDAGVDEIGTRSGRVCGVALANGGWRAADVVVANADAGAIAAGLLGAPAAEAVPPIDPARRSLSAMTWSMVAETAGFDLAHHNVFFPDDYPREFVEIFDRHALPTRPAVYVCAPDRAEAPGAAEQRLFMIANAPAEGDRRRFDQADIAGMQSAVFDLLQRCGLTLRASPERVVVTTPGDFEARFPGTGGALYGMAPHGWRASFTRPGARTRVAGLYLAGGSVHPGPGVPMAALSGRLAAQAAISDLGLPWRP